MDILQVSNKKSRAMNPASLLRRFRYGINSASVSGIIADGCAGYAMLFGYGLGCFCRVAKITTLRKLICPCSALPFL